MGESFSIDIKPIIEKLHHLKSSNPCSSVASSCIYRVDKRIRKLNEEAYTPDTVSIGPYHREANNQNLQMKAVEHLKSRYVQALLIRTSELRSPKDYVEALSKLETDKTRGCYSDPIDSITDQEFIEMMLFDGLFIIELFRRYAGVVNEIDENDPISFSELRRTRVMRDLLLLENQIPMSVLQTLFDLSKNPSSDKYSLIQLALIFFHTLIPYPQNNDDANRENNHKHLLDLISYTLEVSLPEVKTMSESIAAVLEPLPCVVELWHSGVKFKKASKDPSLMHITFTGDVCEKIASSEGRKNPWARWREAGSLEIPQLCVDDITEPFFRNIIAYEQQRSGGRHYLRSYTLLMNYLINSADDVAILRDRGIIINNLGDDIKVSTLFNNLCTEIFTGDFCYEDLCNRVTTYHGKRRHRWRAKCSRDYCNSPCAIISMNAVIILLVLTAWSIIFSTLPFLDVKFKH